MVMMYTKNINHDYHHHHQPQPSEEHEPVMECVSNVSSASPRQWSMPQTQLEGHHHHHHHHSRRLHHQEEQHAALEDCYHQSQSSITTQPQQQQQERMLKLNSFTNYHQQTDSNLSCHNRSKTPINQPQQQSSSCRRSEEHFPTASPPTTLQLIASRRGTCEEAMNSAELSALALPIRGGGGGKEGEEDETRGPAAGDGHDQQDEMLMIVPANPTTTTTCHYHQHGHTHYQQQQQMSTLHRTVGPTKHALASFYRSQGSLNTAGTCEPAQDCAESEPCSSSSVAQQHHNHHHQHQQQQQQHHPQHPNRMLLCGQPETSVHPPPHQAATSNSLLSTAAPARQQQHRPEQKQLNVVAAAAAAAVVLSNERRSDALSSSTVSSLSTSAVGIPARRSNTLLSSHRSLHNLGCSSTLPTNSTLSSLLAAASNKMNDQTKRNSQYKNTQQQQQQQQHQQQQQAQVLRRQTSLSQLDSAVNGCSKSNSLNKSEPKFAVFQQRIKAILSPKSQQQQQQQQQQQKQQQQSLPNVSCNNKANGVVVSSTKSSSELPAPERSLTTLNKYTISRSSQNLSSLALTNHSAHCSSNYPLDNIDEIDDTYNLRNVCNKLYASTKQHQAPYGLVTPRTSSFRNLTSESPITKIAPKESLYAYHNSQQQQHLRPNTTCLKRLADVGGETSAKTPLEDNLTENVVVVSDLSDSSPSHASGLTVRTNQASEQSVSTRSIDNSNLDHISTRSSSSSHRHSQQQQQQQQHQHQQGSNLSLNALEPTESSITSQDHNYKSSSESGRGTMNSQVGDHNNIDLNSPADLTSLDSDQSHRMETQWKEQQARRCSEQNMKTNYNPQIQRYLDNQRCSSKDNELAICKDFKAALTIKDDDDSESWISVSDDQETGNDSKKPQFTSTKLSGKLKSTKQTVSKTIAARANRIDTKLKTNFSKPENCVAPNAKLGAANLPQSKPSKAQPPTNGNINNTNNGAVGGGGTNNNNNNSTGVAGNGSAPTMDTKMSNGVAHDKCIYSVPNKGKYRELANGNAAAAAAALFVNSSQFDKCNNDNDSMTSDPESNFPDDGCSEITDFYNNHRDPLQKQLQGIEEMYSELLTMLNSKNERPKRKLFRRNSGRSSVASRNARDHIYRKYRANDYRRPRPEDNAQMSRRYKKLESQVLTLAKSVSQLSADIQLNYMLNEEIGGLRHDIEMLKSQMSGMKQCVMSMNKATATTTTTNTSSSSSASHQHQANVPQASTSSATKKETTKKVDKLKRLFIDEPQPMKQFLKKLGYEKYTKIFDSEKIGLLELAHLSEERLHKLGIPMGPRIRMLQEVRALTTMLAADKSGPHKCSTLPGESYNIYAMV